MEVYQPYTLVVFVYFKIINQSLPQDKKKSHWNILFFLNRKLSRMLKNMCVPERKKKNS